MVESQKYNDEIHELDEKIGRLLGLKGVGV